MRHDVIGVVQIDVDRDDRQHQAVNSPMQKRKMNPMAKSIGVSKVIDPFHIVASQLNTFTPVGTAISMVAYMKNSWPAAGMPTVNI